MEAPDQMEAAMRRMIWSVAVCLIPAAAHAQAPAKADFGRDIQPIFQEHCVECHGSSQQMRGLRLDRRRDALPNRVGANGARIVAGNSAKSPLYQRVSGAQAGAQMPPTGPLKAEQIAAIRAWIDQGAEWPDALSGEVDQAKADPAVVQMRDALREGNRRELGRLVSANAKSVNAKGPRGWTPLMYAALYGDADAIRLLLDKGAEVNARNESGGTALLYATDDADKTRVLLEKGADAKAVSGDGRTALTIAIGRVGSAPVVKLLLDHGADASGLRPAQARDMEMLRLIESRGVALAPLPFTLPIAGCADCMRQVVGMAKSAGDLDGALTAAIRTSDAALVNRLLDDGARVSANVLQTVALHPLRLPAETIRTMIARGADAKLKTPAGLTMIELGRRNGNTALVEALGDLGLRDEAPAARVLEAKPAATPRAAVERSLPPLQRADTAFLDRAGCVSCHNNSLTAMTVAAARAKGLRVNEAVAKEQLRRIAAFLQENAERALEGLGVPGANDTASYTLLGMAAENYPSDPITDVWARYLKNAQSVDGVWKAVALRPPLELSDFAMTAASIRVLRTYAPKAQRAEYDQAAARGVQWLAKAQPLSTEDHAFQVLGLVWGGGNRAAIAKAAEDLSALQRQDGGWGQAPGLASDAYATGQALTALRESGAAATGAAYQKGVRFLIGSQLGDGSWYVRSRAVALQPYFDSDFPHGTDQFISAAATNWASMALLGAVR